MQGSTVTANMWGGGGSMLLSTGSQFMLVGHRATETVHIGDMFGVTKATMGRLFHREVGIIARKLGQSAR